MTQSDALNESYAAYCKAVTSGNNAAAEKHKWEIFAQYEDFSASMKRAFVRKNPGREDLYERAQLKVFLKLMDPDMVGKIDPEGFKGYLSRSLSNGVRDVMRHRQNQTHASLEGNERELASAAPVPALDQSERFLRHLRERAKSVSPDQLEIYCDYVETKAAGHTSGSRAAAIASKYGTSPDSVRNHVARFRSKLSEDPMIATLIKDGEVPPVTLKTMLNDLRDIAKDKRDIARYWQELRDEEVRNAMSDNSRGV